LRVACSTAHNANGVVHGAVLFTIVDTAMGAATMSSLDPGLA
jgi:acyl-coenzyme A thioesterase PaaI-like protein